LTRESLASRGTSVIAEAANSSSVNRSQRKIMMPAFLKPLQAFWTVAAFPYAAVNNSVISHLMTTLPE